MKYSERAKHSVWSWDVAELREVTEVTEATEATEATKNNKGGEFVVRLPV